MNPENIKINIEPNYLEKESEPLEDWYVFAYRVSISNNGDEPVRLLLRHWRITEGDGSVREVNGAGVVGEQPLIMQNDSFHYTSGMTLKTAVGYMEGHFIMRTATDDEIKVDIPLLRLALPNQIH